MQVALSCAGLARHFGELARKVRDFTDEALGPVPFLQPLLALVFKIGPQLICARFDFDKPGL